MTTFTSDERLALLLNVLGDDVASGAFQSMSPTRAIYLRKLLSEFKTDPPSEEEIEYVIGDFNQYFQFAMQALGSSITDANQAADDTRKEKSKKKSITYFPKINPSNDPIADLNRLDPFQIAAAIGNDHPKTVAMVMRMVDIKQAAKVLELIDDDVRSQAIIFMTLESTVPAPIVSQVLKSTVLKAMTVEFREDEVDLSQTLAELLRSLPKSMRVPLLTQLEQTDPELTQRIKARLYLFDDVLRMDDRDVQKLLAEVESDQLIVALQRCDQEVIDKLLNNLSKRARETIIEEMEYKQGATDEEVEEARSIVVAALAQLDESGDIKLT